MMAWGRGKGAQTPPEAVIEAGVPAGDRLIAAARDLTTQHWVLACRAVVAVVTDEAEVVLSRPWLRVEAGAWDPDADLLRVRWVDDPVASNWRFAGPGARVFTDAFRDRVQASVVLVREVDLGPGRKTRVAIRKDLATWELSEQVVPGRGVSPTDTELAREVEVARATLRDQSGLPPAGAW